MAFNRFKKIKFVDTLLARLQSNIEQFTNQFSRIPFLDGNEIEVTVTSTATAFNHGLQRTPQGYIKLTQNSSGILYTTASDNTTITLVVSGSTTTFKLWVY